MRLILYLKYRIVTSAAIVVKMHEIYTVSKRVCESFISLSDVTFVIHVFSRSFRRSFAKTLVITRNILFRRFWEHNPCLWDVRRFTSVIAKTSVVSLDFLHKNPHTDFDPYDYTLVVQLLLTRSDVKFHRRKKSQSCIAWTTESDWPIFYVRPRDT